MRVAVIHDWFEVYAGAERVTEQILDIYEEADVFALVDFMPQEERKFINGRSIRTSFIQDLPFAKRMFRSYLPLFPLAIEQLDLSGYQLVISSSYAVAKGVITGPDQLHVCYCHSPIRYAWDLREEYLRERNMAAGWRSYLARLILHKIRMWDVVSATAPDYFLANSEFVRNRIQKFYRRSATVIYPPVDVHRFRPLEEDKEDFYLTVSRSVPYKRVPLIVEAFRRMPQRRLVVIGNGPESAKVRAAAEAPPTSSYWDFSREAWCKTICNGLARSFSPPAKTSASCRWRRKRLELPSSPTATAALWRRCGVLATPNVPPGYSSKNKHRAGSSVLWIASSATPMLSLQSSAAPTPCDSLPNVFRTSSETSSTVVSSGTGATVAPYNVLLLRQWQAHDLRRSAPARIVLRLYPSVLECLAAPMR